MMLTHMPRPAFASTLRHSAPAPYRPARAPGRSETALAATTDLSALRGRRLIALIDCENIAREPESGLWMNFKALAQAMSAQTHGAQLHAFFTEESGTRRWGHYFRERGYICHPHPVEVVHGRLRANSDPDLLFNAGRLLPGCDADTLLIASGDGDLVSDIARLARQSRQSMTTMAMGLPGKTSSRLKGRQHVDHCIMIGKDMLQSPHATHVTTAPEPAPIEIQPVRQLSFSRLLFWR